ncbi:anaerobic C4-dicarboxylate transporter [Solitalea koreensis]|uniref:Anaerobic C4-dicarboxylate transporter DcuA n=1 Tax=Solitalea koreensis TaxID=543615 RepID=A0A521DNG4_9SPHI|nr:anaerobic C4-dicarboxylate transporter [Solitalea koreensis]SMO73267.1 anaerobic C4-dicarboxylate transporter DcuA [Solitalea koreensis]
MIWLQLLVLLVMILIGSRLKGIALGLMGVVGVFIYVTFFGMRPADPPGDIMLIIICVVTLSATLEAAGGLDYLVSVAEKIIRRHPSRITIIAPIVSFVLCLFAGTSHVIYSLLPIIADVSVKNHIRPERPLSASVIACHAALTGSPMAACTAAFGAILAYPGAAANIMFVCIPSCFIGSLAAAFVMMKYGKDLDKDPEFLEKMKDPEFAATINELSKEVTLNEAQAKKAKQAVIIFGVTILLIVLSGTFPQIIPDTAAGSVNFHVNADGTLKMVTVIETIALSAAALMLIVTRTNAAKITKASLFNSMSSALVSVFGVVWMAATFMDANKQIIADSLGKITAAYPWSFTVAIFVMGVLMFSQGATTKAMMPLGLALGLPAASLIAMFPAVNSFFLIPGYPTLLAAINMDKTGTTKVGSFVVNHSFLLPGLVATIVSIGVGFLLSSLI